MDKNIIIEKIKGIPAPIGTDIKSPELFGKYGITTDDTEWKWLDTINDATTEDLLAILFTIYGWMENDLRNFIVDLANEREKTNKIYNVLDEENNNDIAVGKISEIMAYIPY